MPKPFNWAHIESGATFHALVGVLLELDDPGIVVFNREGADGAIDALSGDRTSVYQSKHHKNAGWSRVISDAMGELEKIAVYRNPQHRWYQHWKDATTWTLVTNVPLGSGDIGRWDAEVVPAFKDQGLTAEFLHEPRIEAMLTRHPEAADAFFGRRTRLFVSLAEHRESLLNQEVLRRAYDIPVEGRTDELDRITRFVTSDPQQVLLVHGAGGVGKSRLLVEAARRLWVDSVVDAVYCATPSLGSNREWYVGIVPEKKALVLLDDPTDPELVARLLAELRTRTKLWKVLVAVQTPHDPVIYALTDPRQHLLAPPLELRSLSPDVAGRYAQKLLAPLGLTVEGGRPTERWLVEVCDGFPIWMTVAVHLLENDADLRELPTASRIAQRYIDVILEHADDRISDKRATRILLQWVALLQPVNRQASDALDLLAKAAGFRGRADADRAIERLVNRKVFVAYGIDHRMIEVRPHVLRDFILLDWLSYATASGRRPSQDVNEVVRHVLEEADPAESNSLVDRMITSLGRTEFMADPRLSILDPIAAFAADLARTAADTAAQRRAVLLARSLGPFRPQAVAEVADVVLARIVPEAVKDNPFLRLVTTRESVLADLPAALSRAAKMVMTSGERRAILNQTIALVDATAGLSKPYWQTESAADLLPKIVQGRYGFRNGFDREVGDVAAEILLRLQAESVIRESDRIFLKALLQIDRYDAYIPQHDPEKLHMDNVRVLPEGAAGQNAITTRLGLWTLVTSGVSERIKRFAWELLYDLHADLGRANVDPVWRALWVEDLERTRTLAESTSASLRDLNAARGIWSWHVAFDQDVDAKAIALDCEAAYLRNPLAAKYSSLFDPPFADERVLAVLGSLSSSRTDLDSFFEGAVAFARTHVDDSRMNRVIRLALLLGERRGTELGVKEFADECLRRERQSDAFQVGLAVLIAHIDTIRSAGDPSQLAHVLDKSAARIGDEPGVAALIAGMYSASVSSGRGFTRVDYNFLSQHDREFAKVSASVRFEVLGRFLRVDVGAADRAAGDAEFASEGRMAVAKLWTGYFDALPAGFGRHDISMAVVDRLLEMTAELENVALGGNVAWHIRHILKYVEPKPLSWLVAISLRRLERFREANELARQNHGFGHVSCFPEHDSIVMEVVRRIPAGPADSEATRSIDELVALAEQDVMGAHELPRLLADVDPTGAVVPLRIAASLLTKTRRLRPADIAADARFAACYPLSSPSWRAIAIATCERLETASPSDEERSNVYYHLAHQGVRGWSGSAEAHREHLAEVLREAQHSLEAEESAALRKFWSWKITDAEADLRTEEGYREER